MVGHCCDPNGGRDASVGRAESRRRERSERPAALESLHQGSVGVRLETAVEGDKRWQVSKKQTRFRGDRAPQNRARARKRGCKSRCSAPGSMPTAHNALGTRQNSGRTNGQSRVVTLQCSVSDSAAGLKGVHRRAAFAGIRMGRVKARRRHRRPPRHLASASLAARRCVAQRPTGPATQVTVPQTEQVERMDPSDCGW